MRIPPARRPPHRRGLRRPPRHRRARRPPRHGRARGSPRRGERTDLPATGGRADLLAAGGCADLLATGGRTDLLAMGGCSRTPWTQAGATAAPPLDHSQRVGLQSGAPFTTVPEEPLGIPWGPGLAPHGFAARSDRLPSPVDRPRPVGQVTSLAGTLLGDSPLARETPGVVVHITHHTYTYCAWPSVASEPSWTVEALGLCCVRLYIHVGGPVSLSWPGRPYHQVVALLLPLLACAADSAAQCTRGPTVPPRALARSALQGPGRPVRTLCPCRSRSATPSCRRGTPRASRGAPRRIANTAFPFI